MADAPRLSEKSIRALAKIVCGNSLNRDGEDAIAPYRSGPELFEFFNEFGFNDVYSWGGGMPSREPYTADRIRELAGTEQLPRLVGASLDPRHFLETEYGVDAAAEWLNQYLRFDGFEVRRVGKEYRLVSAGAAVSVRRTAS